MVYADTYFLLNTAINYALLIITARARDVPARRLRCLLAAAFGGAYGTAALLVPNLGHWALWLFAGLAMVLLAFYNAPSLPLCAVIFILLAGSFGGIVTAVYHFLGVQPGALFGMRALRLLLVCFFAAWGILWIVSHRVARRAGQTVKVTVTHQGRTLTIHALPDTGNSLTDPMTGKRVLIVGASSLSPLFDGEMSKLILRAKREHPEDLVQSLSAFGTPFRLLPYKTVDKRFCLMLTFTPEEVRINGKRVSYAVSVAPQEVSDGGAYCALLAG